MAPSRRWNLADFGLVLDAPNTPAPDLAARLPRRRPSEIEQIRAAVHAYHLPWPEQREVRSLVTEPMSRYLSRRRGSLTCAVCGNRF
jgi:hypothetical protein